MKSNGYTLVEVLIAAGILAMAVAGAAVLGLTMVAQEEMNARTARLLNLHEQAARLYQLGLSSDEINALLPPEPALVSLAFPITTVEVPGLGNIQQSESTLVYRAVPDEGWVEDAPDPPPQRTNSITVIRPSIH